MPVAQGGPTPARQALTVGIAAILGLLAIAFLVTRFDRLAGGGTTQVDVGGSVLPIGEADDLATVVAEEGPFLFPGPTGSGRDLWLQHRGDDPAEGWTAFAVRAPGAEPDCLTEWRAEGERFVDTCDGTEYAADGDGLTPYPVSVDGDGVLTLYLDPLAGAGAGG